MMLIVLLVTSSVLWTAEGIAIGDPCTNHTYCNYEQPSSIPQTKCESSTCQCTSLYYGETGDTECVRAVLGDTCDSVSDGNAYCATRDPNAACVGNVCACNSGYYEKRSLVDGEMHCSKIKIGTKCNSSDSGDGFCQQSITTAVCAVETQTCECPDGKTYDKDANACQFESFHSSCSTCRQSGGHCYDVANDGTPDGCSCPESKNSSDPTNLSIGCDIGLGHVGDPCDGDGSFIRCVDSHTYCVHAGTFNARFTCDCLPGYSAVRNGDRTNCYRSIAKETDRNCQWCEMRGGICYDIDEDGIRDGCMCPATRSTTDFHDPSKDCEENHLNVTCATSTMTICYNPHNTTRFPNMATRLADKEAFIYIERRLGEDPCRFETADGEWCVELNLATNETKACATRVSYPTYRHISYDNMLVLQMNKYGRGRDDAYIHVYCQYDTISHTFTATGTQVLGVMAVASEGEEIHPALTMEVKDEFGRDATLQGIRLGQPAMLIVEMTEDRDMYHSIRPEVCIASNRPELANPITSSILLLYNACPVADSYLTQRNTFQQDPANPQISMTGLFPMFQFEDTDFVFFHCAVRVCRNDENCGKVNCTSTRRKRAIYTADGSELVERYLRELPTGSIATLSSIQSGPIKVTKQEPYKTGGIITREKDSPKTVFPRKYIILIGIGGGVLLFVVVAALLLVKRRRRISRSENNNFVLAKPSSKPTVPGEAVSSNTTAL